MLLNRFRVKRIYELSLLILLQAGIVKSQCSSAGAVNAGTITPSTSWQTVTHAAGTQYYYLVNVTTCNTYTFTFCNSTYAGAASGMSDTQITITDNSTGTTSYAYNDDHCSFISELIWTPATSGTYRVLINQYNCAAPTASATLAYIYAAANTTNTNYALNGNATSASPYDCTTLTSAANNQLGCAWDVNSTLDFTGNFSYDFTINLGSSNAGADGMSFTIQNDPRGLCACGTAGNQLGAGSISNSLIIEIDTYLNYEDRDDFTGPDFIGCAGAQDYDHLDIWKGGTINPDLDGNCSATAAGERPCISWAVPLKNGASYYDIENGLNHILRISWTAGISQSLTATVLDATGTTSYASASYSFNPLTIFGTNTPYFGFTASTGGLNNQQSFCNPLILLPVEIKKFDANKENSSARLEWTTATETNNKYFSIEKSKDGEKWNAIGKQNSKALNGNSTQSLNYFYYDRELQQGMNYYRIKQNDYNGKFSYSSVKMIENNNRVTPIVFPNPFERNFNVTVISPAGANIDYTVYSALGEIVLQEKETQGQNGYFLKKVDITEGPGIYYMVLLINNERFTYKMVCTK